MVNQFMLLKNLNSSVVELDVYILFGAKSYHLGQQGCSNHLGRTQVITGYYLGQSYYLCQNIFTVERAAKTLHQMSSCTPVSILAKITWRESGFHEVSVIPGETKSEIFPKAALRLDSSYLKFQLVSSP